jgi:hypothetical protein
VQAVQPTNTRRRLTIGPPPQLERRHILQRFSPTGYCVGTSHSSRADRESVASGPGFLAVLRRGENGHNPVAYTRLPVGRAVNYRGVWACTKHELRQMRQQGSGAIVNCSSIGGLRGGGRRGLPRVSPRLPEDGTCLLLCCSGWSSVAAVDAVGGPPYGDFTNNGCVRAAARRRPYRLRIVLAGVASDPICEAGN